MTTVIDTTSYVGKHRATEYRPTRTIKTLLANMRIDRDIAAGRTPIGTYRGI